MQQKTLVFGTCKNHLILSRRKPLSKPGQFWNVFDKPTTADIRGGAVYWQKWAQTGLAALRHANLDLAGFGATNRMTGPSPKRTLAVRADAASQLPRSRH
ncbi:hypothetical protein [Celeribacter halophilus]|uniref:hypothetical protein n=1 Tax=Celeribacter halophilus TaxID=576117 RepID=UPI001C085EB6|nr:hypothetical protein [Celeribacter halophilus]MBU2888092.1 hypothetical protein [Celeribacter halophilus]MDO6511863.1 hypothetical protein [Celeribacter halophilus]